MTLSPELLKNMEECERAAIARVRNAPQPNLLNRLKSTSKTVLRTMVDRGWFGLTPLQAHLVIVGFPRSGTTLLKAMITASIQGVKQYDQERRGLWAAQTPFRNHPYLMTKCPFDCHVMDQIREFYADKSAKLRFIFLIRDPRAQLTSMHERKPGVYHMGVKRWLAVYHAMCREQHKDDVYLLRYEDLILKTDQVQQDLEKFIGWHTHSPFATYHQRLNKSFKVKAMNGVRPPDPKTIDRWKEPANAARIKELLTTRLPQLPELLIELGYAPDREWTRPYLDQA